MRRVMILTALIVGFLAPQVGVAGYFEGSGNNWRYCEGGRLFSSSDKVCVSKEALKKVDDSLDLGVNPTRTTKRNHREVSEISGVAQKLVERKKGALDRSDKYQNLTKQQEELEEKTDALNQRIDQAREEAAQTMEQASNRAIQGGRDIGDSVEDLEETEQELGQLITDLEEKQGQNQEYQQRIADLRDDLSQIKQRRQALEQQRQQELARAEIEATEDYSKAKREQLARKKREALAEEVLESSLDRKLWKLENKLDTAEATTDEIERLYDNTLMTLYIERKLRRVQSNLCNAVKQCQRGEVPDLGLDEIFENSFDKPESSGGNSRGTVR